MQHVRYDRFSVTLHWLMAALVLGQIALGLWMIGLPKDGSGLRASWFNVHKSWGMVLGLLIVLRLAWALLRPRVAAWPQARAQRIAARSTHQLLYALLLLMPLSGFLGSVFSGYPIRFFGLQLPQLAQRWDAAKALCSAVHQASAIALGLLIALHVLAALYHQCVLKDGLLQRMRWRGPGTRKARSQARNLYARSRTGMNAPAARWRRHTPVPPCNTFCDTPCGACPAPANPPETSSWQVR